MFSCVYSGSLAGWMMCSEHNIHVTDSGCRAVLRSRAVADLLLGLWVRIPFAAWISVFRRCCVWSVRGPYEEPIPRQKESYRVCVCVCVWPGTTIRSGTHNPYVTWAHVMLECERRFNIEFYDADSHFCHSAYVTWSHVELWSTHVPARLSNFCCRTHFVRRDVRVERSSDVTSCFQKWTKCLLKKCANGPSYMTPSDQIIEISIWEQTYGKG
jgi:hypothetical protein